MLTGLRSLFSRRSVLDIARAMFSQGLVSASSFGVGIIIARFAAKQEYGLYVLLFSIIGIFGNYHNAMINTPFTVLFRRKEPRERENFLAGLATGQWLFIAPLVALAIAGSFAWSLMQGNFAGLVMISALSAAIIGHAWREFLRTVNYGVLQIGVVLSMDIAYVAVIAITLTLLALTRLVSSNMAIVMLAGAYGLSAFLGALKTNALPRPAFGRVRKAFIETWQYSRWALVGVSSGLLQNRGYIYVITAALGLEEVANVSAARLLIMPVGFLVQSSGKIVLAKGAQILHRRTLKRFLLFSAVIAGSLFAAWAAYETILWLLFKSIVSILGDKYQGIAGLAALWSIFFFLYAIRYPISNSLLVCRQFKTVAIFDCISGVFTITACIILTAKMGAPGAITALVLGELLLATLAVWRLFFHIKRNDIRGE